jgi:hypothetical protein
MKLFLRFMIPIKPKMVPWISNNGKNGLNNKKDSKKYCILIPTSNSSKNTIPTIRKFEN